MRATVVVALGVLTACSSSASSSAPTTAPTSTVATTTTPAATTTTSTTITIITTTTTAIPTTTTVAAPRAPTTDAAAGALLNAWKAADRVAAALVADAAAVDALFARPYLATVQDRGCSDGTQSTNACTWRYQGEIIVQLTLDGSLDKGFRIVNVQYFM